MKKLSSLIVVLALFGFISPSFAGVEKYAVVDESSTDRCKITKNTNESIDKENGKLAAQPAGAAKSGATGTEHNVDIDDLQE